MIVIAVGCGSDDADRRSTGPTTTTSAAARACPEVDGAPPPTGLPPAPEESGPLFRPETYREGDRTVMPVTFPDGTTADLVYEPSLGLEGALISPGWAGGTTPGEVSRDLLILPGSFTDRPGFLSELVSTELVREDALVCRYHVAALDNDYLVLQFEDWFVFIHSADDMSSVIRRTWAEDLTLRTARDGFPVLGSKGGIHFQAAPAGPGMSFQKGGPGIIVILDDCALDDESVESGELDGYGTRCVPGTGVAISANHYAGATVDEVLRGVEVRNVMPAS